MSISTSSETASLNPLYSHDDVSIKVRGRENYFDSKRWWMCDLKCDELMDQGATPIVARCMRKYGWDEEFARRVLLGYKQFLTLKNEHQDWYVGDIYPCFYVDLMWHEHSSDLQNYLHDCFQLCQGHIVYRDPDAALDRRTRRRKEQATRDALKKRFGMYYDEALWSNKVQGTSRFAPQNWLLRWSKMFCRDSNKAKTPKAKIKLVDEHDDRAALREEDPDNSEVVV